MLSVYISELIAFCNKFSKHYRVMVNLCQNCTLKIEFDGLMDASCSLIWKFFCRTIQSLYLPRRVAIVTPPIVSTFTHTCTLFSHTSRYIIFHRFFSIYGIIWKTWMIWMQIFCGFQMRCDMVFTFIFRRLWSYICSINTTDDSKIKRERKPSGTTKRRKHSCGMSHIFLQIKFKSSTVYNILVLVIGFIPPYNIYI